MCQHMENEEMPSKPIEHTFLNTALFPDRAFALPTVKASFSKIVLCLVWSFPSLLTRSQIMCVCDFIFTLTESGFIRAHAWLKCAEKRHVGGYGCGGAWCRSGRLDFNKISRACSIAYPKMQAYLIIQGRR